MIRKLPTTQRERGNGGEQDAIVSCDTIKEKNDGKNQGDDKRTDETDMDAEFVNSNLDNDNAEQESILPRQILIGDKDKFDSGKIGSPDNGNQRVEKAHAKMRKRLRLRPTAVVPDYSSAVVPDSDDDVADFSRAKHVPTFMEASCYSD